jgi:hypothetical protein
MLASVMPLAVDDCTFAYDLTLFGPPAHVHVVLHETELPDALTRFELWLPDVAADVPHRFWQSWYAPAASHCVLPVRRSTAWPAMMSTRETNQ